MLMFTVLSLSVNTQFIVCVYSSPEGEWVSKWVEFHRHWTHSSSFRRRVFPGNHLHWYWQLKINKRKCTKSGCVHVFNSCQFQLCLQQFLADWLAIYMMMLSVCLSVSLSVTVCIVARRYILQQKYLNKWIRTALLGTQLSAPYIAPEPSSSPPPRSQISLTTACSYTTCYTAKMSEHSKSMIGYDSWACFF